MPGFLKKFFGGKEAETISLSPDAIPAWLDGREAAARTLLESDTRDQRTLIRNSVDDLRTIVGTLRQAEQDPELHPKIRSIAKNSLPLFLKGMHSALDRSLPEAAEDFYGTSAELLKNCLNVARGQGRYLQIAFPEEMKAIRQKIDAIGREINAMTAFLSRFRREKAGIDAARSAYEALAALETDLKKSTEKDCRAEARIREMAARERAIDRELDSLAADPRLAEITDLETCLRQQERDRDTAARTYAALSMTASHVLRKAEKIAVKQKHPSEAGVLRQAIALLSDHEIPRAEDLEKALASAYPIARRMIDAGEIVLKNREERGFFAQESGSGEEILTSCASLLESEKSCQLTRESLALHPLLQKKNSLERERAQLGAMRAREELTRKELGEWQAKARERLPDLYETLTEKLKGIMGEGVQVEICDPLQRGTGD